ncbi:MAG TPA: hypothetical protein EYP40_11690, partial [Chromatiales bacterium]|nr:hypothetical protein [Chromatiales bacterium]
ARQARLAVQQLRAAVTELLAHKLPADKAAELADQLSRGQWTHDYPLTPQQAQAMGLPVSTDMPDAFLQLMALYPQPVQRIPSVEYLPGRRTADHRHRD